MSADSPEIHDDARPPVNPPCALLKAPTGIAGFDDLTLGGLPAGRPTLICGAAGSGKTLFALTFLVNGVIRFGEPAVFISFEERASDLAANCASIGYDLNGMLASGQLAIDHVHVERSDVEEAGSYDLDGLFIRLACAVDSVGAKRIVLDTIESLFSSFSDTAVLRAEVRRLFNWMKDRGLTAIITAETGHGQLTRYGLEEYVSDCVVLLDNRVKDEIATRRLRIVKYRGSTHGVNEYPFLIDTAGISVLSMGSINRSSAISDARISSGIKGLDTMLQGDGFFQGTSILLAGVAGTGKTTIASHFLDAACARGERAMAFLFEERAASVCRNIRSVGIDLERHVKSGLLRLVEAPPSIYGLEMKLARIHRDVDEFAPQVVVIDPISAFRGAESDVHAALLRLVNLLGSRGVTALFTSLRSNQAPQEDTEHGVTSLMDAWIELREVEENGERNRVLYVIKARGLGHSNQMREFTISNSGIELIDAYVGPGGLAIGTARVTFEAGARVAAERRRQAVAMRKRDLARRRMRLEREIADLRRTLEGDDQDEEALTLAEHAGEVATEHDQGIISALRGTPA